MFSNSSLNTWIAITLITAGLFTIISCLITYVLGKYTYDNNEEIITIPGILHVKATKPMAFFAGGIVVIILGIVVLKFNSSENSSVNSENNYKGIEVNQRDDIARLSKEKDDLKRELEKFRSSTKDIAKVTCDSLARTGYYGFHKSARYIFTSDDFTEGTGIRATAVSGSWEDVHCEADKPDGTYLLRGTDNTTHEIEIKDEKSGQFFRIGTAKAKYESVVQIKSDGTLGLRRMLGEVGEMIPKYDCPKYEEIYSSKMNEYNNERKRRHTDDDSKQAQRTTIRNPCVTLRGQDNSEIVLAFACNDYTRTLIQQEKNTRVSLPQQNKQCNSTESSE